MENLDVMVLRTLRDWRRAGKLALLATVVRTWGSSPRSIGSIMALAEDGAVVGSVSGGCIEDDLIYRHTQAYAGKEAGHQMPWGLETALELRHVGNMAVDDRNTDFAASSTVFNLRLSVAQVVNRWTFREFLRIDNLADRNYVGSVIVNEANRRYFESAPGRSWLVGANALYAF